MLEGSVGAAPSERRGRPRLWRLGLPVALAVVVTVVAIAVSGAGVSDGPHLSAAAARMQSVLSGIPQHGTMLGSPSARVTVTEFADLQCPYCDAYSLTLFPLLTGYVQSGQVKMVYRTMAFIGRDSVEAGRAAAAAAEQNKLWSFVDAFYYNQGAENSGYVTPKFLRRVGALVPGLDVNKMMTRMRSSATLIELRRMTALAHARNVHATPTFLIDAPGRREERVVGFTTLKRAIQNDLRP
jgi:protein-disulfide isomerase